MLLLWLRFHVGNPVQQRKGHSTNQDWSDYVLTCVSEVFPQSSECLDSHLSKMPWFPASQQFNCFQFHQCPQFHD